jgi:hypothetical protein
MPTADETRAAIRSYADGWQTRDPDLFDHYADDAVFHYSGATDLAGSHVGKEACLTAMITARMRAPGALLEIVDVLSGDALGALVVRERLERDGEAHEIRRVLAFRVDDDGRLAECWLLDEDQALIDHLWRV